MIYAVEILDKKFVKIGFTAGDTKTRIAELQTGSPFEIKELFTVEGTLKQEQSIHDALLRAFTRVRMPIPPNEWYPGRNNIFSEFLDELRFGANNAMSFLDKYDRNVKQPGKKCDASKPNIKWPVESNKQKARGDRPFRNRKSKNTHSKQKTE